MEEFNIQKAREFVHKKRAKMLQENRRAFKKRGMILTILLH